MDERFRTFTDADWRQAQRLLATRRYADAWPLYEARRGRVDMVPVDPGHPEWTGQALDGRRIVVCAEQGVGDQIMFGRYIPLLQKLGARVAVGCNVRVLGRLFMAVGWDVAPFSASPWPASVPWTYFGSLPLRLAAHPPPPAYLKLPMSSGGGVGVMPHGNAASARDIGRRLPEPISQRLLSLGRSLAPEATAAKDFLDTAALMSGLDLVITVDTAVAHLAGAMGKPCWVLLNGSDLDWRWNDGLQSDWYPDFRLFTARNSEDWPAVLDRIESALADVQESARPRAEASGGL